MPTTRRHRIRTAALAALLAPLLVLGLVPGTASADVTDRDPERVSVPSGANDAGRTATARRAAPASIDSDVYAYTVSPSSRTYFVVAGRLRLTLKSGSTTRYTGSFTDYSGGKTTAATADASKPEAPTLSVKARNGSFTFRGDTAFGGTFYSGTGTKVPKGIGFKAGDLYLSATQHALKTATYQVVLSERVGPVAKPFEYTGTMTIAYDANSRISGGAVTVTNRKGKVVTNAVKSSGYFSTSYFYTVLKVDTTTMGVAGTFSGTSFSGNAFSGSGSKTAQWVISGTL